jgi:hypothetical protein
VAVRAQAQTLGTRAVSRLVEPGNRARCSGCGLEVTWKAREGRRQRQVIANCYENGKWDRVEWWHTDCYESAGQPHGAVA